MVLASSASRSLASWVKAFVRSRFARAAWISSCVQSGLHLARAHIELLQDLLHYKVQCVRETAGVVKLAMKAVDHLCKCLNHGVV